MYISNPPASHPYSAKGTLIIVADGMGGHAAGARASRLAVDTVARVLAEAPAGDAPLDSISDAITHANDAIFDAASSDIACQGMGTTISLLLLRDGIGYVGHIGDSRIYHASEGWFEQLTRDDTVTDELIRNGVITSADALYHPDRGALTRALGTKPFTDMTVFELPAAIRDGDRFILCSDGLHDLVSDDEIRDSLIQMNALSACHRLIALALERGAHDNVSVAVVAVMAQAPQDRSVRDTLTRR